MPVYSLYSETREPTAEMLRGARRAGRSICRTSARASTPTSTRWPTACAPRAGTASRSIVCDRPNPIGGVAVEGPMLVPRLRVVRRAVPDPDAPRHDHRRARAAVQRALRHRRRPRGRRRWTGWRREMYFDDTGLPWVLPSPNIPTLDSADRLSGHGAVRRHQRVRRARDDEAVRAGRRAVGRRGAVCRRDEPRSSCPACISVRRCSSRRSTSTRQTAAAAARSTCSIARRFAPVETGVALIAAFRAADPGSLRAGAIRRTNTSTTSCRSTSSPDRRSCASRSSAACRRARSRDPGRRRSPSSRPCATVPAVLST